jgi:hypothetical protein
VKVEDAAKLRAEALKSVGRRDKSAPTVVAEPSGGLPAAASDRRKTTTRSSAKPESQTNVVRDDASRPTLTRYE